MLKQFALLSSVAVMMVGLGQSSVQAATSIAMDDRDIVYRVSRTNLDQANVGVLQYCAANGGINCRVIQSHTFTGYGAVAMSVSRVGSAIGYDSQEEANQAALSSCLANTPTNETCRVVLQFLDQNVPRPKPVGCINPATGLPMLSGYCWGVDVRGNPYGTRGNW
jgi:hypothetical protein